MYEIVIYDIYIIFLLLFSTFPLLSKTHCQIENRSYFGVYPIKYHKHSLL